MGYERAISDVQQKQSDAQKYKSDIDSKQEQLNKYKKDIDERVKKLESERYSSNRKRQLYAKKEKEELLERKSKAIEDLSELSNIEADVDKTLSDLSSQKVQIEDYRDKGYDIEESDDGYRFFKETQVEAQTKTRQLSKSEWMALKDHRPESFKSKISESSFENALWSINSGKEQVITDNIKFYKKPDGSIGFSEGYKIAYDTKKTVDNPIYKALAKQKAQTQLQLIAAARKKMMPNSFSDRDKIDSEIKKLQLRIKSLDLQLKMQPKTRTGTITQYKTVFPTEGQTLYDLVPEALQIKNPDYRTIAKPSYVNKFSKLSSVFDSMESRINTGVTETIPSIQGWTNLVTGKTMKESMVEEYKLKGTPTKFSSKVSLPETYSNMGITNAQLGAKLYERDVLGITSDKQFESWIKSKGVESFKKTGNYPFFFNPDKFSPASDSNVSDKDFDRIQFLKLYDDEYSEEDAEKELNKLENKFNIASVPLQADIPVKSNKMNIDITGDLKIEDTAVFTNTQYAGGTTAVENIPGTIPSKVKNFNESGTTGDIDFKVTGQKGLSLSDVKGDNSVVHADMSYKKHRITNDIVLEEAPWYVEKGVTFFDSNAEKVIGDLKSNESIIQENINTRDTNIQKIEEQIETIEAHPYSTILYDINKDKDLETVSKQTAIKDLESILEQEKARRIESQTVLKESKRLTSGITTAANIGYKVFYDDSGKISIESPSTREVYEKVTGSKDLSITDHIIHGDFAIETGLGEFATLVTGDESFKKATEEEIMGKSLQSQYRLSKLERRGGNVSLATFAELGGSEAGQTVILTGATYGVGAVAGAAIKSGKVALKGTKIGAKFAKLGAKITQHTGDLSFKVGSKVIKPISTGATAGLITGFELVNISNTFKEDKYAAPGKLGTHFLRFGLGWKAFESGMKAGYGKALPKTEGDFKVFDPTKSSKNTLRQTVSGGIRKIKDYSWYKAPRITGNINAASGRVKDFGKQMAFDLKSSAKSLSNSRFVSPITKGIKADISVLQSSSKLKGLKQAFTKSEPAIIKTFPDEHKEWVKLSKKTGQYRDLHMQFSRSDDTEILVQKLYEGKGIKPDVFKTNFKGSVNVLDDYSSGVKILRKFDTQGEGITLAYKELVFFKGPKGEVQSIVRYSGNTSTIGASTVKFPTKGRFTKLSSTKVFDFAGASSKIEEPGLVLADSKNNPFKFITAGKSIERQSGTMIKNLGYGKYNPVDEATVSIESFGYKPNKSMFSLNRNQKMIINEINLSQNNIEVIKGKGGTVDIIGKYTPPKGVDSAVYKIKGSMITIDTNSPVLSSMKLSKIKQYNPNSLISNVEASASLTGQQPMLEQKIQESVLSGMGDVIGKATAEPMNLSIPVAFSKKNVVSGVTTNSFSPVGAAAEPRLALENKQIMSQDYSLESDRNQRLAPTLTTQFESNKLDFNKEIEPGVSTGFDFDTGIKNDYERKASISQVVGMKSAQLQRQSLKLRSDLDLDLDFDIGLDFSFGGGFQDPGFEPPAPTPFICEDPLGARAKRGKKNYDIGFKSNNNRIKMSTKKKVLANPFRVMESQIKFGKATHPETTEEMIDFGMKHNWDIPTVELMNEKKKKSKKKNKMSLNKNDWGIKL